MPEGEGQRLRQTGNSATVRLPFHSRAFLRAAWIWLSALAVAAGFIVAPATLPAADALSASDFNPGFIISDELFYDGSAMTTSDIQSFLDAKIGSCQNGRCLNVTSITSPSYPSWTSPSTGEMACDAVTGGTMSAAEWIYRVQTACSISAKVILVTLQKEQGLIEGSGARAPGDWGLMHAMGMACPDTAPCSTAHEGLATQIYTGTEQMKVYKAARFGRQPGVQYIQWSPNADCGGTYVDVQNFATAALYNYTPYQPNAAALANLYGSGDGCSAYGNRNFWRMYNDWFGNTNSGEGPGSKAISEAWAANGGRTGTWGNRLTWMACNLGVTCGHLFENVYVGWTAGEGIYIAKGAIKDWVVAKGIGVMGSPNSPEVPVSANGGGRAQSFTNGLLNWGPAGPFVLTGAIREEHARLGGVRGSTGWPTSAMTCEAQHCAQSFQHAVLGSTPDGQGVSVVTPAIIAYYLDHGGPSGPLGAPQSQAVSVATNGGGTQQSFHKGLVNVTPNGIFTISQLFRDAQTAAGGVAGAIGWPTAEQVCASGVCSQTFEHALFISRDGKVRTIADPELLAYFQSSGGLAGSLGYPLSDKILVAGPNGGGWQMAFERGLVESSSAGTFTLRDAIRDAHGLTGGVGGALGWPTGEQSCAAGACAQTFQNGLIYVPSGGVARTISSPEIAAYFANVGGAGARWARR